MIEKAKATKSAEELLELARAAGVEMTAEEAKTYFAQLNPKSGELDDDDLDAVAGGACTDVRGKTARITSQHACPKCGGKIGTIQPTSAIGDTMIVCVNRGEDISHGALCTYEIIG